MRGRGHMRVFRQGNISDQKTILGNRTWSFAIRPEIWNLWTVKGWSGRELACVSLFCCCCIHSFPCCSPEDTIHQPVCHFMGWNWLCPCLCITCVSCQAHSSAGSHTTVDTWEELGQTHFLDASSKSTSTSFTASCGALHGTGGKLKVRGCPVVICRAGRQDLPLRMASRTGRPFSRNSTVSLP